MYGLDSMHVCVWVYSRLRLSTDTLDMTSKHDEPVLYRCAKLFDLSWRGEKASREGVREIRRDKQMFVHALESASATGK